MAEAKALPGGVWSSEAEEAEMIKEMSTGSRRSLRRKSTGLFPPPESTLLHPEEDGSAAESTRCDPSDPGSEGEDDDDGEIFDMADGTEGTADAEIDATDTEGGTRWHVKIVTDEMTIVKPRRPMPTIKVSDLYANLKCINGKWIFRKEGGLNEWPALVELELKSLTCTGGGVRGLMAKAMMQKAVKRLWSAGNTAEAPDLPPKENLPKSTRATFVAPRGTSIGWAADSPGFVWWYSMHTSAMQLRYGEKMIESLQQGDNASAYATKAHAFAHRYPVEKETLRDKNIYHAAILIEWSHGMYTTLCELAFLNGCSGYNGRSNWCLDKLETPTQLDVAMPASMKAPWDCSKSEIRMYDMPFKNQEDLRLYLSEWSAGGGHTKQETRFVEPAIYESGDVRLRLCTPAQLAGFMINYIHRASQYIEWETTGASNCQTFAADLFSFLTGNKESKPYGKIIKAVYNRRTFSFLYRPGS